MSKQIIGSTDPAQESNIQSKSLTEADWQVVEAWLELCTPEQRAAMEYWGERMIERARAEAETMGETLAQCSWIEKRDDLAP